MSNPVGTPAERLTRALDNMVEASSRNLTDARAALVTRTSQVAADERRAIDLVDTLNRLIEAETQAVFYSYARTVYAAHGYGPEFAAWVIEQALVSPDDTWSGRGNDARRVAADARREAVQTVARFVKVGES